MAEISTRERILDAAENLFAEEGYSTSLRRITSLAGVNLAAVNYHFGSKETLIREVFVRRLGPLNAERLRLLETIEGRDGDGIPALEPIVEAFIGPPLRLGGTPGGATFMRLFGQTLGRRDGRILGLFADQFRTVVERFRAALGRALPDLDSAEVFWRLLFMVGAMAHTMTLSDKLVEFSDGACGTCDVDEQMRRLLPFLVAGLRAGVAAPPARSER